MPASLSKFVFCQYKFWNEVDERCIGPEADDENFKQNKQSLNHKLNFLNGVTIRFNRSEEHVIRRTEEFCDYCTDSSLAIEVWGHHNISDIPHVALNSHDLFLSKYSNLIESWQQVRKSLKVWVDILELDKMGQWVPVNVKQHKRNHTGGVYQLKQGTSKRIKIRIEEKSIYRDLLPLYIEDFSAIEIGCVQKFNLQRIGDTTVLDSYQEEDLNKIRENWLHYLDKRKAYIDSECKVLIDKAEKTSIENEREKYLYEQLVELAEERNIVYTPPPNSHLPGSILNWTPDNGMESNIPILFLDSNNLNNVPNDTASFDSDENSHKICGNNCLLTNELPEDEYFTLPIINKTIGNSYEAISIWDSTIHENSALNLVTPADQFVYLIVKIKLKIMQPIETELYLRKRICVQIYDPNNLKNNIKKTFGSFFSDVLTNIAGSQNNLAKDQFLTTTSVTYHIISNLPKFLEDYEQYDNLAIMAAINNNASTNLIDKYLERYLSCIRVVDSLLENDKKRQEAALKQAIRNGEEHSIASNSRTSISRSSNSNLSSMKKTTSVPSLFNSKTLSFGSTQNINNNQQKLTQSASSQSPQYNKSQQPTTPVVIKSGQEPKIVGRIVTTTKRGPSLASKFDQLVKPTSPQSPKQPLKPEVSEHKENTLLNDNSEMLNSTKKTEQVIDEVKLPPPSPPTVTSYDEVEKPKESIATQLEKIEEICAAKQTQEEEIKILEPKEEENAEQSSLQSMEQKQDNRNLKPDLNDSFSQMSNSTSETSLLSTDTSERDKLQEWVRLDAHVIVKTNTVHNQPGFIRYIGETKFAKGIWIGVELERTRGLKWMRRGSPPATSRPSRPRPAPRLGCWRHERAGAALPGRAHAGVEPRASRCRWPASLPGGPWRGYLERRDLRRAPRGAGRLPDGDRGGWARPELPRPLARGGHRYGPGDPPRRGADGALSRPP